jgi:uncharacterized protein YbbK (DUF523 family)
MNKILVSACLLGEPVRYHGGDAVCRHAILLRWRDEGRLVPICPEVWGGLPVPRPAAEIRGGGGGAVLDGLGRVVDQGGRDVTDLFLKGARLALEAAEREGVRLAILKDKSPSCGSRTVYDGTFSGTFRPGSGVTAALLERHGIRVFTEAEIPAADAWVRQIEGEVRSSTPRGGGAPDR